MQHVFEFFIIGFLVVFLVGLLLLLVSIFFQFRWLVPFVPTPMPIVTTMVALATLRPGDHVVDLGAGDGRFLIAAKRKEPMVTCIGYEGAIVVWMLGKLRIFLSGQKHIRLECKNFFREDVSQADVIFTYLSMHVMQMMLPKFARELRPGTRIVSHAFRLPGHEPVSVVDVPMSFGGSTKAYLYVWKGRDERVANSGQRLGEG